MPSRLSRTACSLGLSAGVAFLEIPPAGPRVGPAPTSKAADADKASVFVSYAAPDGAWAEWIAWELEEAGYHTGG